VRTYTLRLNFFQLAPQVFPFVVGQRSGRLSFLRIFGLLLVFQNLLMLRLEAIAALHCIFEGRIAGQRASEIVGLYDAWADFRPCFHPHLIAIAVDALDRAVRHVNLIGAVLNALQLFARFPLLFLILMQGFEARLLHAVEFAAEFNTLFLKALHHLAERAPFLAFLAGAAFRGASFAVKLGAERVDDAVAIPGHNHENILLGRR